METILKFKYVVALMVSLSLLSCSSPRKDGEKAARAFNESEQTYQTDLKDRIQDFVDDFDSYGFTSRVDARKKINDIVAGVKNDYEKNLRSAKLLFTKLQTKYSDNYEDSRSFETGFAENRRSEKIDTAANLPMQEEINLLIKSIIPPKPDGDKMKKDLAGRFWQDKEDGYFGISKHIIKDGTIKDVKIVSETDQHDSYLVNVILNIQEREGSAIFKIDSDIKYILGEADDWTIDYLGSNSVDIQKTGQFNKYISTRITEPWLKKQLEISNHSDATLIVGGTVLDKESSEWRKFAVEIAPNSTKVIGGLASIPHYGDILEYEIHFVERK